jgi:hypothetical protein
MLIALGNAIQRSMNRLRRPVHHTDYFVGVVLGVRALHHHPAQTDSERCVLAFLADHAEKATVLQEPAGDVRVVAAV